MTAPPLALGVAVVMAESLVNVNGLPLYTMDDGAISLTVMVTVAVELPPELLAVSCTVSGMRQPLVFLKWHRWSWKTGGLRAALAKSTKRRPFHHQRLG